jgi:hypothetical protein
MIMEVQTIQGEAMAKNAISWTAMLALTKPKFIMMRGIAEPTPIHASLDFVSNAKARLASHMDAKNAYATAVCAKPKDRLTTPTKESMTPETLHIQDVRLAQLASALIEKTASMIPARVSPELKRMCTLLTRGSPRSLSAPSHVKQQESMIETDMVSNITTNKATPRTANLSFIISHKVIA